MDFHNVSVLSVIHIFFLNLGVLSFYCRKWRHALVIKGIIALILNYVCSFLRPENEVLARAYKLLFSVHLGVLPLPYQKLATLLEWSERA